MGFICAWGLLAPMAVEPVQFTIGPVSQAAAAILAGGTGAYAILTGWYALRAFRAQLEDRWSAAVATLVMAALAWLLATDGARLMPAPFSVGLVLVYVLSIAITLTYTLGRYRERIAGFTATFGKRLNALLDDLVPEERQEAWARMRAQFAAQFTPTKEARRKAPHLLMGIFVVLYAAGFVLLRAVWSLSYANRHSVDPETFVGEGLANLYVATHAVQGTWLVAGQMLATFCFLGLLYCIVPTELLRLRFPELSYPFKGIILSRLRRREHGLFGAHYYIAASLPLAALWLTRDTRHWDLTIPAMVSVLMMAVFADAASALVGTSLGKRKWFHNPRKSYLGSVGGTVVAILLALPLVGLPLALATGAVFLAVDIVAPVPFSVSDNLLNPLVLAPTYALLQGHLDPWVPFY